MNIMDIDVLFLIAYLMIRLQITINPPFGSTINKAEKPYLSSYELGKVKDVKGKEKDRPRQSSEILFIERIWEFLKPSVGKAAIVLPDGVLTNSSSQYVQDFIQEKFQLLAVVSLPQHAFAHFGAGVKASIIFVRKRNAIEKPDDNEAIFMAAPELIGYDATGRKTESQLDEIIAEYETFRRNPSVFLLNSNIDKTCVFAIMCEKNLKRFDVRNAYYSLLESTQKYKKVSLGSLVKEEPCYGTSAIAIDRTDDNQPKYIRITDFDEYGIDKKHKFMTAESYSEKHLLEAGDVLFARTGGTVGKTYYDKLDYWQKNMASELYDEFGDGSFTSSMIFAKLEYNKDRAIATLHTFSMMGILGTDLDAIDGKTITYQFRVTPAEHPECFEKAA